MINDPVFSFLELFFKPIKLCLSVLLFLFLFKKLISYHSFKFLFGSNKRYFSVSPVAFSFVGNNYLIIWIIETTIISSDYILFLDFAFCKSELLEIKALKALNNCIFQEIIIWTIKTAITSSDYIHFLDFAFCKSELLEI